MSAVLKRFEDDGRLEEDLPLLHWGMQDGLYRIQIALDGVLQNFPSRFAALVLQALIFPLGQCRRPPAIISVIRSHPCCSNPARPVIA